MKKKQPSPIQDIIKKFDSLKEEIAEISSRTESWSESLEEERKKDALLKERIIGFGPDNAPVESFPSSSNVINEQVETVPEIVPNPDHQKAIYLLFIAFFLVVLYALERK
jgi:hypothetical protein